MAPSGRRRKPTRKPRRTQYKKHLVQPKNQESPVDLPCNSSITSSNNYPKISDIDFEGVDASTNTCSTPKGKKFRIPEIRTCPPAPKKQRVLSNCSLQRSPIAFFAPPDIELFFFFALGDVSV